MTAQARFRWFR